MSSSTQSIDHFTSLCFILRYRNISDCLNLVLQEVERGKKIKGNRHLVRTNQKVSIKTFLMIKDIFLLLKALANNLKIFWGYLLARKKCKDVLDLKLKILRRIF